MFALRKTKPEHIISEIGYILHTQLVNIIFLKISDANNISHGKTLI